MEVKLTTDKACFNVELRDACRIIAIIALILIVIGSIFTPNYYSSGSTLIGFVIEVAAYVCLYFGAQLNNQLLVLIWLIHAVVYLICWPIAVLGIIFNFGDYRRTSHFDNVFLSVFEYIVVLIIFLFIVRIVYSFWRQLRGSQSNPQHSVVV